MKQGVIHDLFEYSPIIDRKPLRWPNGANVAVWVVPNIEHFELETAPGVVDIRNLSQRDYGNRVAIWRLMDVLERNGIRGTVALNAAVCKHYPRVIEEALKRNWELMGHGLTNSERLSDVPPDQEREIIQQTVSIITEASGKAPRGWLGPGLTESPYSLDFLRDAGIDYVCDWVNDDQPYRMKNGIYSIPYSIEINDLPVINTQGHSIMAFHQMICDTFDTLYKEGAEQGRVMCLALHPFVIATPGRIGYLDKALEYIRSHEKVWLTTGSEIIDWYKQVEVE
jgi:allantoinase